MRVRWVRTRDKLEIAPPWWFGLSYYDFALDTQFWHPIPFNYAIKGMRAISHWWVRARGRRSWFDAELHRALLRGHDRGFVIGRRQGASEARESIRKELYGIAVDVVGEERAKTFFRELR